MIVWTLCSKLAMHGEAVPGVLYEFLVTTNYQALCIASMKNVVALERMQETHQMLPGFEDFTRGDWRG